MSSESRLRGLLREQALLTLSDPLSFQGHRGFVKAGSQRGDIPKKVVLVGLLLVHLVLPETILMLCLLTLELDTLHRGREEPVPAHSMQTAAGRGPQEGRAKSPNVILHVTGSKEKAHRTAP